MEQVLASGEVITLIHLTFLNGDLGVWRIACMPNLLEFGTTQQHPNYQMTDDVRAVTCPICKATAIFVTTKSRLDAVLGRLT